MTLRCDLIQIPYYYTVQVANRFEDLIDRVPKEIWLEIHKTEQEAVTKISLNEKKHKKAKWFSEEALQITDKRREAKGKVESKSCKQLNVEFQRIARRDKKAFLSDQCKEIEGNNRMEKN